MNSLDHVAKFSAGLLPFTYSKNKQEALSEEELSVVSSAKTVGAGAMSISAVVDLADISRTVSGLFLTNSETFNSVDFSQDLTYLAISALWAGSNIGWLKRNATVNN